MNRSAPTSRWPRGLNYYALDRLDLLFPVQELMRKLSKPTEEDEEALKQLFSQFGSVTTVTLRRRREAGKVSWALVTFAKSDAAKTAVAAFADHEKLAKLVDKDALLAELLVRPVDKDQVAKSRGGMTGAMDSVRPLACPFHVPFKQSAAGYMLG